MTKDGLADLEGMPEFVDKWLNEMTRKYKKQRRREIRGRKQKKPVSSC